MATTANATATDARSRLTHSRAAHQSLAMLATARHHKHAASALVRHARVLSSSSASTSSSSNSTSTAQVPRGALAVLGALGVGLGAYTLALQRPELGNILPSFAASAAITNPARDACAGDDDETRARRLSRWLCEHGGALDKCALKPARDGYSGVSAFYDDDHKAMNRSKRRGKEEEIMRVPGAAVVNVDTAARHPTLFHTYDALLRDGTLDERLAVMVFLMIERRRGEESVWKNYIDSLPRSYDTPLYFTDEELERELKGTNVYGAVQAQAQSLKKVFELKVKPAMGALIQADNAAGGNLHAQAPPGFDEFKWAYATFWSRVLAIPVGDGTRELESIVPGIDMVNHVVDPKYANARWEYVADASRIDGGYIVLISPRNRKLDDGEELFMSYGDKSNEELLFTYGFSDEDNENDMLVLQPPWANEPVEDRSGDVNARVAELAARGLPQHVILPRVPPKRGYRDLDHTTQEILRIWVSEDVTKSTSKPSAETVSRIHAALRAALGAQSSALRHIERDIDENKSTARERACAAYRRAVRRAIDAYLDAASAWPR